MNEFTLIIRRTRPQSVEGVQLTQENIDAVAQWSSGQIVETADGVRILLIEDRENIVRVGMGDVLFWDDFGPRACPMETFKTLVY